MIKKIFAQCINDTMNYRLQKNYSKWPPFALIQCRSIIVALYSFLTLIVVVKIRSSVWRTSIGKLSTACTCARFNFYNRPLQLLHAPASASTSVYFSFYKPLFQLLQTPASASTSARFSFYKRPLQLLQAPASMSPDYDDVLYRPCPIKLTTICSQVD